MTAFTSGEMVIALLVATGAIASGLLVLRSERRVSAQGASVAHELAQLRRMLEAISADATKGQASTNAREQLRKVQIAFDRWRTSRGEHGEAPSRDDERKERT